MLERFARGKCFTQGNPLLAIVVILRMKRKFSMNFRTSPIYYKTAFSAHIPVKDRLQGRWEIIPWLKALISRHCAFMSYPCTHTTIRCETSAVLTPLSDFPRVLRTKVSGWKPRKPGCPVHLGISVPMALPTLHLLLSARFCSGVEKCPAVST